MSLPASSALYADLGGLDALRLAARRDPAASLPAVARQFESLFVQQMLKAMRAASPGDPLFDSQQSQFYREQFDQQLAVQLSGQGAGLGLADAIVRQLGGGRAPQSPSTPVALPRARREGAAVAGSGAVAATAGVAAPAFAGPLAFVRSIWEHAKAAAAELGTGAEVLVAQAALETGWGRQVPRRTDGGSSHNLFGIKAGQHWPGARVAVPTLEFRDGVMRREQAAFRAYDSLAEGFADYVDVLRSSPRYRPALAAAADPQRYAAALQQAGYATDPGYGAKIRSILQGDTLQSVLGQLKW